MQKIFGGPDPNNPLTTTCGTPPYMAPEVRHAKNTNAYEGPPADIFALGQILFIIHTAKFAF